MKKLTHEEMVGDGFHQIIEQVYPLSKAFSDYMKKAPSI